MLGYEGIRRLVKGKQSDLSMIEELYKNLSVGVAKVEGKNKYIEYPRLVNKSVGEEGKMYDTYVYTLPLGISFSKFKTLEEHLTDGLGRDVKIESGERIAKIRVAREVLGDKIPLEPFLGKTKGWKVLIGVNAFEAVTHDFDAYPNIVGGGAARFGKTVLMKNIIAQLILQNPDTVRFHIIDLKGGVEFWEYEKLKQVKRVTAHILDAHNLLEEANVLLMKRMVEFKEKNINNIVHSNIKERDFIIIDEAHDLFQSKDPKVTQKKRQEIEYYISKIAAMGPAFGIRVMAFTQYPVKAAMPQFIKQNSPVRIAFQVADDTASRVILDKSGAEDLPGIPGRCMVKSFKYTTVQVPWHPNHFELVKQYEVSKSEPEHGTEIDKGSRDIAIHRQAIVPK